MPYVDESLSVCRPGSYNSFAEGDIVVTLPSAVKIQGRNVTIPPLSLIGKECKERIDTLCWVDGIAISRKLKVNLRVTGGKPERTIADIKVTSPNVHTAFTLKRLLDGKEIQVYRKDENVKIIEILKTSGITLAGINAEEKSVEVFSDNLLLKVFGYSLFYYLPLSIV
jgi:hypothetical protein